MTKPQTTETSLKLLPIRSIPEAVFELSKRISDSYTTVFFPEAGSLPLKECFNYLRKNHKLDKMLDKKEVFSSKLTALSKCPLSKQIIGLLSESEGHSYITDRQVERIQRALANLSKNDLASYNKALKSNDLKSLTIAEFITRVAEIGLYIPTEDRKRWSELGITEANNDLNFSSTEPKIIEDFHKFRHQAIKTIIDNLDAIHHPARTLLNIVLEDTTFGTAVAKGNIYVIDEAISRGRTLNTIEIVFRSFYCDAMWGIGALFCPDFSESKGVIDYVYSNRLASPFSNRLDIIGNIIVESDNGFSHYNLETFPCRSIFSADRKELRQFEAHLSAFITEFIKPDKDSDLFKIGIKRFLMFCLAEPDSNIIQKCLDLNPCDSSGLIEEVDFYINMPHPFSPLHLRNRYKASMESAYQIITDTSNQIMVKKLSKLSKHFKEIRTAHENEVVSSWIRCYKQTHQKLYQALDKFIGAE